MENSCESIAFPLISSGIYGYPKAEALRVATSAIQDFLVDHDIEVFLVMFDKAAFDVSKKLLGEVKAFIDENYVDDYVDYRRQNQFLQVELDAIKAADADAPKSIIFEEMKTGGLEDLVGDLDEPFAETLFRLIDAKGKTDVEVYKRANLDRKLFSKIRRNKGYMPSKCTAIALAVAMELSLDETDDLLERAGYVLSRSQKFDVIIQYFITSCNYNIYEINEVLFSYDQPLLGG
ncbi:hypothetical protein BRE01_17120 [Brevibacillus reuszeri]|uniref:Macro domain-containing protein n=1 Tax=Brevibacillus reuszeri TaxID=54915 RepID=A0ABQ0TJF9_9BACL|nr:hypothetical protein BRE01_17120 [Brevibacillus reuszeri]